MTETRKKVYPSTILVYNEIGRATAPIRIYAALDFSVIINLDSSKYSRQPWATAIYEINRAACESKRGRERREGGRGVQ